MRAAWKTMAIGVAGAALLQGCFNQTPSNKDIEVAIHTMWQGYTWEFSDNFDLDSVERINGWQDGEDYWVETAYKVKANKGYYAIVENCVAPTVKIYHKDGLGQLAMGLSALKSAFQGNQVQQAYSDYRQQVPESTAMQALRAQYGEEAVAVAFADCVQHLQEQSDSLFKPSLQAGDLVGYTVKLRFKKTEQGWRNL